MTHHPHIEHLRLPVSHGKFPKAPIILEKLHTLEIEGLCYLAQANRVVEIVKLSPHLKTLKIYWIGCRGLNSKTLKDILRAAPNLETLFLGSKNSDFEFTNEMLQILKSEGKKLKKFTTYTSNVDEMRAKMREIHDSGIKCTALSQDYVIEDWNRSEYEKRAEYTKDISTCEWKI